MSGAVSGAVGISAIDTSGAIVRSGAPPGAEGLPARDAPTDRSGRDDRELVHWARVELSRLAVDYQAALDRGLGEESRAGIDAAFDEADRLQRQMLVAIRRLRALEDRQPPAATAAGVDARLAREDDGGWRSARDPDPPSHGRDDDLVRRVLHGGLPAEHAGLEP